MSMHATHTHCTTDYAVYINVLQCSSESNIMTSCYTKPSSSGIPDELVSYILLGAHGSEFAYVLQIIHFVRTCKDPNLHSTCVAMLLLCLYYCHKAIRGCQNSIIYQSVRGSGTTIWRQVK